MKSTPNPFAVTRAVDFSDGEILRKWVNPPGEGGVNDLAKPSSAMPMMILGGKGSGKTHLMRFLSTSARVAGGADPQTLSASGFLGIYLRCGGINASRFAGKGRCDEEWSAVFMYYMDLTLAELALRDAQRALPTAAVCEFAERKVCTEIFREFQIWHGPAPETMADLNVTLAGLRRAIDIEVNNCALTKNLNVTIAVTPGRLVLAVPQALASAFDALSQIRFVYLIDELENLSESQQIYVNSLVRENAPPCSVKVGARLYGPKTYRTLSSEEELKEGSEYERLVLDEYLRAKGAVAFRGFSAQLCVRRLKDAGFGVPTDDNSSERWMTERFESRIPSALGDSETDFVDRSESRSRPWMKRLHKYLRRVWSNGGEERAEEVLNTLAVSEHPLVERVGLHAFYQDWFRAGPTLEAARTIRADIDSFLDNAKAKSLFKQKFSHWHADMLAQIYRDYQRPMVHAGFPALVHLAHGLPRHLLVILKHIFSWSLFREERPFSDGIVSVESQRLGINDAAEWFFHDARMAGPDGERLQTVVGRLAELMRGVRFSDKPSEVEVCAFSANTGAISAEAQRILRLAEKWSLIGSTGRGRLDRNSYRVDAKYRLNPLLAVRWDLSVVVRGDLSLSPEDLNAVLTGPQSAFDDVVQQRSARMRGPHFGRRDAASASELLPFIE